MQEELLDRAIEIRDETEEGANTAVRVGSAFESFHTALYAESIIDEYTRDIITTENTPEYIRLTELMFYENHHLLFGKYIESVSFYTKYDGHCYILFGRNVGKSTFNYDKLEVPVTAGTKNTIILNKLLGINETIGIANAVAFTGDTTSNNGYILVHPSYADNYTPNKIGGRLLSTLGKTENFEWDLSTTDLCLTVTERVVVKQQGDIPRLKKEKLNIADFETRMANVKDTIVISQAEYDYLVEIGAVKNNVVYMTYEGDSTLPTMQEAWVDTGLFTWKDANQNSLSITESGKQQATLPDVEDGWRMTSGDSLFSNSIIEVAPNFEAVNIVELPTMFKNCINLKDIPLLNTSNCINFFGMFQGCSSLTAIPFLNTVNGVYFHNMFEGCSSLVNIPQLDTSNGTSFSTMFNGCSSLTTIPLLNTSNGNYFSGMFKNCISLTSVPQFDTSNGTYFTFMFQGCTKLTTIPLLNTANGIGFFNMFDGCTNLTAIPQLDTSNGTSFSQMFYGCTNLETIELLDVSKSTNFSNTFSNCSKLTNAKLKGIMTNITFPNSPLLTQESIEYLIDNAQTVTGQTITLHATALARVTAEYKQKATNKGWTVK